MTRSHLVAGKGVQRPLRGKLSEVQVGQRRSRLSEEGMFGEGGGRVAGGERHAALDWWARKGLVF